MRLDKAKLYILLAKHCMTMRDLAKKSGVSTTTCYKGIKEKITPAIVGKIARALCCNIEDIIIQDE